FAPVVSAFKKVEDSPEVVIRLLFLVQRIENNVKTLVLGTTLESRLWRSRVRLCLVVLSDMPRQRSSGVVAGPRFRCQMAGGLVPGINPEGSRIGYMAAFDRRIGCVVVVRGNGFQAND
nr:hypothetical protein [Tanacetum cinerariifolium]